MKPSIDYPDGSGQQSWNWLELVARESEHHNYITSSSTGVIHCRLEKVNVSLGHITKNCSSLKSLVEKSTLSETKKWCLPCLLRKHLSLSLGYSSEAPGRRTLDNVCDLAQRGWVWCEQLLQLVLSPGAALLLQGPLYEASSRKCCLVDLAKKWTEPCGVPSWLLPSLSRSHGMASISSEKF